MEKVLSLLSGKSRESDLHVTHDDLVNSIKNVKKGKTALPLLTKSDSSLVCYLNSICSMLTISQSLSKLLQYIPFLSGIGAKVLAVELSLYATVTEIEI